MENSTFEAIYTGVYIFIFIIALSITIFLFKQTNDFADRAYNYNVKAIENSVILNAPAQKYRLIDGYEVVSYFYNYIKRDSFGDNKTKIEYVVTIKNQSGSTLISSDTSVTPISTLNSTTLGKFIAMINVNTKYVLTYKTVTNSLVYIDIQEATQDQINATV